MAECLPCYVWCLGITFMCARLGICHTESCAQTEKLCFELFGCIYGSSIVVIRCLQLYSRLLGQICTCRAHCDDFSLLWSFRFPVFLFNALHKMTIIQSDSVPHFHLYAHIFFCFRFASTVSIAATLFHQTAYNFCNNVTDAREQLYFHDREKNKKKKNLMFSTVSILTSN